MIELKPCPCCGSNQNIVHKDGRNEYYIRCEWCPSAWVPIKSKGNPRRVTKKDIIGEYNNRPIEAELHGKIDEMDDVIANMGHANDALNAENERLRELLQKLKSQHQDYLEHDQLTIDEIEQALKEAI